jgi:hypothetical protein
MAGTLQDAIHLIKQGKKQDARGILEGLLRSDPKEAANWFWYAETLETPEQRVKVLELCLKANPGNPQAEKALAILRAKIASPAPPTESKPAFDWDALESAPVEPAQEGPEGESQFSWETQPKSISRAVVWDEGASTDDASGEIVWDDDEPDPGMDAGIDWDSIEQAQAQSESPPVFVDEEQIKASRRPQTSYAFYDVWLTALTSGDQREYQSLLRDPEAGQFRAYEWMAYLGLLSGLLLPLLSLGEFNAVLAEFFPTVAPLPLMVLVFAASAIFSCIASVLGLMISAGIQFLIAIFLGGRGTFSDTVYALGAYLAPYTIVSTVIAVIPLVQCISPLVAIYGLVLNVRALRAAHDMTIARALMVIFLPSILLLVVGCLIGILFAPVLGEFLSALP